jgi:hypothetical protein
MKFGYHQVGKVFVAASVRMSMLNKMLKFSSFLFLPGRETLFLLVELTQVAAFVLFKS